MNQVNNTYEHSKNDTKVHQPIRMRYVVATILIAPIVSDLIQNVPMVIEPKFPFNYIYNFYYYSFVIPAESPKVLWSFILTLVDAPALSYVAAIVGVVLYVALLFAILGTVVMKLHEMRLVRAAAILYLMPLVIAIVWQIAVSFM